MRRLTPLLFLPVVVGLILLYTLPVRAGKIGGTLVELVSVASDGTQGNHESYYPAPLLSNDGRYVGFTSRATNLVANDTNNSIDTFLRDRSTNTTTRISVAADGTQLGYAYGSGAEAISADGQWLLYVHSANDTVLTDTNGTSDVYLRNLQNGEVERISVGWNEDNPNDDAGYAAMTPDANLIVYQSRATNLVPTDTNAFTSDIFLYNRSTGVTTIVSTDQSGQQQQLRADAPSISADGTWVVFSLTDVFEGEAQIYAKNLVTGELQLVSVGSDGSEPNGRADPINAISANGQYVAFASIATNLDPTIPTVGAMQVYVRDLTAGITTLISVGLNGNAGQGLSYSPVLSADGRYVAFHSTAFNLVVGDTNNTADIFVYDRVTEEVERVSVAEDGTQANDFSLSPSISADGRFVAFTSAAENLVMEDANGYRDVFVYDRFPNSTATPVPSPTATASPTLTPTPTATATPPTRYIYLPLVRRQ